MNTNSLVLTGKYLGARETRTFGDKGFAVRKFYIDTTTNPDYPNTPEFQLTGDKVNLVDTLQIGQIVQVTFNVSGKKYVSKATGEKGVINSLSAWKIDLVQLMSPAVAPAPARPASPAPAQPAVAAGSTAQSLGMGSFPFANEEDSNDLPF